MAHSTVRIGEEALQSLRSMAAREGQPMRATLAKAIETYRRIRFLEDVNAGYAALRANPQAWAQERQERTAWDGTLADGFETTKSGTPRKKPARRRREGGK